VTAKLAIHPSITDNSIPISCYSCQCLRRLIGPFEMPLSIEISTSFTEIRPFEVSALANMSHCNAAPHGVLRLP
jgi:hypothetical protein